TTAAVSPDGRSILTNSGDQTAQLWDAATGQQVRSFKGHADGVLSVAFSPDGRSVLTGSYDYTARLWDVATGQQKRSFGGFTCRVTSVGFSPDGRFLFTSSCWTVSVWDAATGKQVSSIKGETQAVNSVAFSPDGRFILTGNDDGTVRLWDAATGQQIRSFEGHRNIVNSVAFSPDGRHVLSGSYDNTARLWDVATGQQIRSFTGHTGGVISVTFSPNGRFVLTGSDDRTARLWDAATGQQVRSFVLYTGAVLSAIFSPDSQFVITVSDDRTTRLWDAATGKELAALVSFENGGWAVVDPEGRFDTNDLDGGAPLVWVASREPMRALPLEIFMRNYYTPRLLSRIMSGEMLPPVRSIAQITNRVQPDVAVVSTTASKTHPGRADVVVHAASHINEKGQASGLQDLRLFRNGQMVGYLEGSLKDPDFTFSDIHLPTSVKSVTFTAYAFNAMNIKSATAQKDYSYEPGAVRKPHAYLLQIGVNHYRASNCELHGSATDAEELSRVLTERLTARGLDVKPVRLISTGTENGATKDNIRKALQAIAAVATPDDVFFLSFSGHGFGDQDGQFYIFPSNVEGSCQGVDDAMLKLAISADELAEWLRPIDAGEMTFVLDSCQSASSVEANDFKPGPMGSRGLGQLAYDKRMRILAASQSNQEAQERNLPVANGAGPGRTQGLLSYALTQEGLVEGKADWKPVDQKITVGEWLSYAADAVPKSLAAGAVKTTRGMKRIGPPTPHAKSAQIPAVFDFSKKDAFVLQEGKAPAEP
ncbi:MAG: caspase family protein, partial [Terracidiphilus sp.]